MAIWAILAGGAKHLRRTLLARKVWDSGWQRLGYGLGGAFSFFGALATVRALVGSQLATYEDGVKQVSLGGDIMAPFDPGFVPFALVLGPMVVVFGCYLRYKNVPYKEGE